MASDSLNHQISDLKSLVDENVLKELQDRFTKLLGFNVAFAGLDCQTVGKPRYYFAGTTCDTLMHAPGSNVCLESDKEAGRKAKEQKKTILYRCQSYCSNFVIPICVQNEVVGFIYSGQFFVCEPANERQWNRWNEFLKQNKDELFVWNLEGTSFIHPHFFSVPAVGRKPQKFYGWPTRNNLLKTATAAEILDEPERERFVALFKKQSDPDGIGKLGNRVKHLNRVMSAIRMLSSVANALAEECTMRWGFERKNENAMYVLKTVSETHSDVSKSPLGGDNEKSSLLSRMLTMDMRKETRQRSLHMKRDLELLDETIRSILKENERGLNEKELTENTYEKAIETMDRETFKIYRLLLVQEMCLTERDLLVNQIFYHLPQDMSPKDIKQKLDRMKEEIIKPADRLESDLEELQKDTPEISQAKAVGADEIQKTMAKDMRENLKRALEDTRDNVHEKLLKNRGWRALVESPFVSVVIVGVMLASIPVILDLLRAFGVIKF